ncbi:MAG: diphthine synthase [Nanoarchaeota archaeon]
MFYLIGLGLNENGYSKEASDAIMESDLIYVDVYTVDFPYSIKKLESQFKKKKFISAKREFVESFEILENAEEKNVALLVYGSPLSATTHISLIEEAKQKGIEFKIIHGASILDAVAETGLHLYKFGKITSMPKWQKNFMPESFMDVARENHSIKAHTLILCDIGLSFKEALEQLETSALNRGIVLGKIIVCQSMGTKNQKIFFGEISKLKKARGIENPFCLIIPSELHFTEKEVLEKF